MPHEEFHDPLAPPDPLRDWYVNTIWGKRVDDDDLLFEVMSLQVFQAGLTWRMILNKRDGFRSAFDNWSIESVAGFTVGLTSKGGRWSPFPGRVGRPMARDPSSADFRVGSTTEVQRGPRNVRCWG